MNKLLGRFIPPDHWKFAVIVIIGIFIGLIIFSLHISKATSYLSDSPATCINCHIMVPQYATWNHSSHREFTTCNDCHVPQDDFLSHYYFKAKDGLRHATIYTLRAEPQVIQIKKEGILVVQQNCIRCHNQLITSANVSMHKTEPKRNWEDRLCWDCHKEVPHGKVNSLSSVPNARAPLPKSPVPEWIKELTKK